MALSSAFPWTNTSSSHTLTPAKMALTTGYGINLNDAGEYRLKNAATSNDVAEIVTFRKTRINNIASLHDSVENPSPTKGGIQCQVRLDEMLVTTSSTDDTFRQDDPVVLYVTLRCGNTSKLTATHLQDLWERLEGTIQDSTGNVGSRLLELVRGNLIPSGDNA